MFLNSTNELRSYYSFKVNAYLFVEILLSANILGLNHGHSIKNHSTLFTKQETLVLTLMVFAHIIDNNVISAKFLKLVMILSI